MKFYLHISKEEQRERFLARAAEAEKHWKFSAGDVAERKLWDDYKDAYERRSRATSTKDAPWYVIPADHKWLMRTAVASILVHHLEAMDPRLPEPSDEERAAIAEAVARLRDEREPDRAHDERDGAVERAPGRGRANGRRSSRAPKPRPANHSTEPQAAPRPNHQRASPWAAATEPSSTTVSR